MTWVRRCAACRRRPPARPPPEPGQHTVVETGVRQLRPQGVFPVDRTYRHRRGLPVGEVLGELQHRHQRQGTRREPRRPTHPNASANGSSAKTSASRSRTRMARLPLGNAARATTAVCSGTGGRSLGRIDIYITPAATRQERRPLRRSSCTQPTPRQELRTRVRRSVKTTRRSKVRHHDKDSMASPRAASSPPGAGTTSSP